MAQLDANQVAQSWADGLARSGDKITRGVQAVTTAPGQAAAANKAAWVSNTQAAADKWARRTASVSLNDWQSAMTTKGIARIGAGAAAAQPKMASFLTKFLPYVENVRASLPKRGSYEQNKLRATAMMDGLHKFQA